jgi:hypothetical protein
VEPEDDVATLTDEEIRTRELVGAPRRSADDSGDVSDTTDTGDDSGDVSDTTDTGDDAGDTADTTDTGDDSGAGPA